MEYKEIVDIVYEAYYECRKHKRTKESSMAYAIDYEDNLRSLIDDLYSRRYKIGKSIVFGVTRPKCREVFAADFRDRIVHHALIIKIGKLLDNEMITDSYNCRKGKGTLYGIRRLQQHINEVSENYSKPTYVLQCDFKGYFMSIDKVKCLQKLQHFLTGKLGRDEQFWMWLLEKVCLHRPELLCEIHGNKSILDNLPDDKTLFRSNGKGLAIGNLTSQIFGNFYLTEFDKHMQRLIGDENRYGRYVDDWFVVSRDKDFLLSLISEARELLKTNLGITLHPDKVQITEARKGIKFLGNVIKPHGLYIGDRTVSNAIVAARQNDVDKVVNSMNSYFGLMKHTLSYAIRKNLYDEIRCKNKIIMINTCKFKKKKNYENNSTKGGLSEGACI